MKYGFGKGIDGLRRALLPLCVAAAASWAHAGLITAPTVTANGASIQATQTAPNAFHVEFTPPAHEVESVQKVYYALYLGGRFYFKSLDGHYHEWTGGEMTPLYANAQSACRTGNSFGFTSTFAEVSNLDQFGTFLPAGTALYVGYGASQDDMVINGKYAPVYVVVK